MSGSDFLMGFTLGGAAVIALAAVGVVAVLLKDKEVAAFFDDDDPQPTHVRVLRLVPKNDDAA